MQAAQIPACQDLKSTFLAGKAAASFHAGRETDFTAVTGEHGCVQAHFRQEGYVICDMMKFRMGRQTRTV